MKGGVVVQQACELRGAQNSDAQEKLKHQRGIHLQSALLLW
jgi:hypothetical protein